MIKNVIGFCAFVLALGITASAHAYVPGVWDPQPRVQTGESSWTSQSSLLDANTNTINNNTQYQNQNSFTRAPYFWETGSNSGATNQANNTSSTKTVATNSGTTQAKTSTSTTSRATTTSTNSNTSANTSTNSVNNFSNLPPVVNGDTINNLGASAAYSGSFMPSSIGEWFLVLILVLIIVIIARLIARSGSQADHGHAAAH
jgi:lipopolysaccharide export LptBFGC system permease protein LptF